MSNGGFQFKQFKVEQTACAMKVTTDACIQGAWTPILPHVRQVLDIGTGTGLLSLMLAQRNRDILIDAIELDNATAIQAKENFIAAPWGCRINIWQGDAVDFPFPGKYDLIICNPPFFNDSLLSNTAQKSLARHNVSLSQNSLLKILSGHLGEDGYCSVLLPLQEYKAWRELAAGQGLSEIGKLHIRHTSDAKVKRVVSLYSRKLIAVPEDHIIIKDDRDEYTPRFIDLLAPFYLKL